MTDDVKSGVQGREPRVMTHYDTRLPFAKRMQIPILVGAGVALEHILGPTLRFDVVGREHFERVLAAGRRCIFSFWHRTIFLSAWWFRNRGIVAMTSANFDGQLLAGVLQRMGYGTAQGSSSRGGLRGLANLAERMAEGRDATFAVDGPRGPRYIAKPGMVLLARRTGCPLICLHSYAARSHTFQKSWDRFQIPYPFSRVVLIVGRPIEVPADASRQAMRSKQAEMQQLLERARDTAESWFTLSPVEQERQRALWNA